ncbi:ATP-binding protein [Methylocapsa acidiphila]|uniref:ATP-binding protein n=1 Tax=Methylocapsa acidiphila TaxID=133552 RepID=UPI00042372F2|nr:ATP-binding protein [Methylocapsa acidiphila]
MLYFTRASASMRARLIFIPSTLLALGIVVAIVVTLSGATDRIRSEIASGVNLGSILIGYALDDVVVAAKPEEALRQLQDELAHIRHITVRYSSSTGANDDDPVQASRNVEAPQWFVNIFEPERIVKSYPVTIRGQPYGELVMWTKPSDEVAEIWNGLVFLTGLLAAISVGIVTLISLTANQMLRPLNDLVDGLGRLQRGQFSGLGEICVGELRQIGEQFNRLARSLARTEADNHLLIDRMMSIEEAERKELARELHDEFGASLFGIRAAASCIIEDASSPLNAERRQEIISRAEAISALADSIQKQNYRILERIRPVILHQVGLLNATRHLVEDWRSAHRDVECELRLPDEQPTFDEEVSLTSYRIIQECLTNVARHAKARSVRIALEIDRCPNAAAAASTTGARCIHVSIEDDGVGLPSDFRFGFGFLGMSERVRKLGGQLKVSNGPEAGALVEAVIPVAVAAA